MNSTERSHSLWIREDYRRPLLNYIGKIYGKRKDEANGIVEELPNECRTYSDLEQLYYIIQLFEKQPGLSSLIY